MIKWIKQQMHSNKPILLKTRQWLLGFSFIENIVYHAKWSDEVFIRNVYKERFGVYPNLKTPKNFNEKNNWRKLHDRKTIYTSMVDKYQVKTFINQKLGDGHVFELLGVWDNPKQIQWDSLPNQFVLKCNHAGGVLVCRDKSTFNRKKAIKRLEKMMKINYYLRSREWPYKNVERKIIAERYMGENLIDYKNYCFDGEFKYTFVWQNHSRTDGLKPEAHFCGAFDRSWHKTDMEINYPSDDLIVEKPEGFDEMITIAEKVSSGIPFVRVDCYIIDAHVYIGEMTFFPWGGFQSFKDEKWNDYLGQLEKLPGIDE